MHDIKQQFIESYRKYFSSIYKYCLFRVSSVEDAQDITETTFMKTWDYITEGKKIMNYRAFLFRIAHNQIVNLYNKRSIDKDKIVPLTKADGSMIDAPDGIDIHAKTEIKELYKEIIKELNELKPEYRDVMLLRYVEDMEFSEIAQALEISEENVRVRIHRAIKKVKEAIQ